MSTTELPAYCYARFPGTGAPIIIRHLGGFDFVAQGTFPVERINGRLGVTAAQVEAMVAGAVIGWDSRAAAPGFWDSGENAASFEPRLASASYCDAVLRWNWAGILAEIMTA